MYRNRQLTGWEHFTRALLIRFRPNDFEKTEQLRRNLMLIQQGYCEMSSSLREMKLLIHQISDRLPPIPTPNSNEATEVQVREQNSVLQADQIFEEIPKPNFGPEMLGQMPQQIETVTTTNSNGVPEMVSSEISALILEDKDSLEGTMITRSRKVGNLNEAQVFEEIPKPVFNVPCVFGIGDNDDHEPVVDAIESQYLDDAEVFDQMPEQNDTVVKEVDIIQAVEFEATDQFEDSLRQPQTIFSGANVSGYLLSMEDPLIDCKSLNLACDFGSHYLVVEVVDPYGFRLLVMGKIAYDMHENHVEPSFMLQVFDTSREWRKINAFIQSKCFDLGISLADARILIECSHHVFPSLCDINQRPFERTSSVVKAFSFCESACLSLQSPKNFGLCLLQGSSKV